MPVLIAKNVTNEGPGTIAAFLEGMDRPYDIVDLTKEDLPAVGEYDTLIMLGGPMSVNNTAAYPYLQKEIDFACDFMKTGKRVLGVCLGAQLMARALGAKVYPGPEKEIGWYDMELVDAGPEDPLMSMLARGQRACKVFQWHGETFDIPRGAERLAQSDLYPNQAFRYGNNAYAFQFHIEVSKEMISDWLKNEPVDMTKLGQETEAYYADYAARAESFYESFFDGK